MFNGEILDQTNPVWNQIGINFKAETLYKIEETYFEGKIWLEITG